MSGAAASCLVSDFHSVSTLTHVCKIHCQQSWGNLFYSPLFLSQRASLAPLCFNQQTMVALESEAKVNEEEQQPNVRWDGLSLKATEGQMHSISKLPPKMPKRCKAFMKRIICFSSNDNLPLVVSSWVKTMKPRRAHWLAVLKEMKKIGSPLFLEVLELALVEDTFEANIRDYTKLIDSYAKEKRLDDAENAFSAMKSRGFICDQVTLTVLVHMYSKAGDLNRAKETFEDIKLLGMALDKRAYDSMIMAYVRAGMPEHGESLLLEMDSQDMHASREVYKALLRAYSTMGNTDGAQRVFDAIQFAGVVPDVKFCTLLVNAYCVAGQADKALGVIQNMSNASILPNDKCVALLLAAYEKENRLDKAMSFLMELERHGVAVGREATEVLLQWLNRLGLADEISQPLGEFSGV